MAELVDALDLGSNEETRTGSSPARPTKTNNIDNTQVLSIFFVNVVFLAQLQLIVYGTNKYQFDSIDFV